MKRLVGIICGLAAAMAAPLAVAGADGSPPPDVAAREPVHGVQAGRVLAVSMADRSDIGADATSVMLNATVTDPAADGFLTLWPCGQQRPVASNMNFVVGQTTSVAALVGVGSDGEVCVSSNTDLDVVLDADGWFGPDSPYRAITPTRITDTRNGDDDVVANVPAGQPVVVDLPSAGVPYGAPAVMLSVTITNPELPGYVVVWPCRQPRPLASSLDFAAQQTIANAVLAMAGTDGRVCVESNVAADVVIDLQGWLVDSAHYTGTTPERVFDTRHGQRDTIPNLAAGLQAVLTIPASADASMLNVTVTNPSADGFLTVWPCGQPMPLASNLNFVAGQTVANAVLATPGVGHDACVASNVDVDVVVDLQGVFDSPSPYHSLTPTRIFDSRD